jgi:alpha-galactosidase
MRARSRFRYLLAPLPIVRSGNNCACADHCTDLKCFVGDVNAVIAWGFDGVKLDGCGRQENIQLWYDLFNWTLSNTPGGKPMLLENCHNGPRTGSPAAQSPFGPFAPTRDWCPFHMYRSSNDIRPQWGSILSNLQTIPPLAEANLSRPGCWAYPDMLEVGITVDGAPVLNFTEARTHFGAWCIVSSPLILGLNMSDSANVAAFWPILSNEEAIAVNQECVRASARARQTRVFSPTAHLSSSPPSPNAGTRACRARASGRAPT